MSHCTKYLSMIAAAFAALFFAVSCQEKPVDVDNSSFVVSSSIIRSDIDGGDDWFNYSISGPKKGSVATVTSYSDWITVKDVFSTEFRYSIAKNDTGADRTGDIVLTCDETKSLHLRVIQSGNAGGQESYSKFEITVSDITTSTCRIQVKPVDAGKTYLYAVVRKAEYDKETPESYIKARITQIEEMAAMYAQSPSAYLSKGTVDTDNLPSDQRPSLYDRTDFYMTAFDLSYDESTKKFSYSGEVDKVQFRSATATPSSMKIEISQSGNTLTFRTDGKDSYICDFMEKSSWDELDSPDFAAHQYVLYSKKFGYFASYKGTRIVDMSQGSDFVKGTTYVAYAVGYRDSETDSGLTTEVVYLEFTY